MRSSVIYSLDFGRKRGNDMNNVKSITPNAPADFTPTLGNYKSLQPFRYWCQKVLPLVYDDSLSYYELLCKVVDYLNKTMEDVEILHGDVTGLHTAYVELQSYVNNYFNTLDVQKEIDIKLDEMAKDGFFDSIFTKFGLFYATPQMFGALGDGVHDDSEAISKCLNANKFVFIPKGYYKISKNISTYCRDSVTVICDTKAIFIADTSLSGYMFTFSEYKGYSHFGVNWRGGIFCCNGVSGLTGILINSYSSFGHYSDITVIDIGNNGCGIEMNITSGKNTLDNINIFGAKFNIDIADPTGNISVNNYDLTRNNIGLKNTGSYDYSISTIYVMGCRVGIYSNGGAQVNVSQYHYWVGTDGGTNKIRWADYINTRAFKCVNNADHWHFNMFYPDKPYIGAECGYITCDNTHYISMVKDGVTDYTSDDTLECFLGKSTTDYGVLVFNQLDVVYSEETRLPYHGISASNLCFVRGGIRPSPFYPQNLDYLHPSLMLNYFNGNFPFKYKSGEVVIGYICATLRGSCHFNVSNVQNQIACSFDIVCKDYNGHIFNCKGYAGVTTQTWGFKLGTVVSINGYKWIPLIIFSNYTGSTTLDINYRVTGNLPFVNMSVEAYTGSTLSTAYVQTEKQNPVLTVEIQSQPVNIPIGANTFSIHAPTFPEGYVPLADCFFDGYVNGSKACIVTLYRTNDNNVDVINTSDKQITNGVIHLKTVGVLKS